MAQYENEYAVAAIMANADYESDLCAYRYEGDKEKDSKGDYPSSLAYTRKVNSGEISRSAFIDNGPNGGGYGLFSWTGNGRKGDLYDYAKAQKCSIADWKMQLDFAYKEITERYYSLYVELLTAEDVSEATESFSTKFEKSSDPNMSLRIVFARQFLEKYGSADYTPKYKKGELLPVNQSYDYMNSTFKQDIKNSNVYIYIAQYVLNKYGYLLTEASGFFGTRTADGISLLEQENGLKPSGILTPTVWKLLDDLSKID